MRLVLDSNEYILALGSRPAESSRRVLATLGTARSGCELCIARTIVDEVLLNLPARQQALFFHAIAKLTAVDEDWVVAPGRMAFHEALGLKPGDAFIAAYAEQVGADVLVSENRHFLSRRADLPFRVLSAEEFLALLESREA